MMSKKFALISMGISIYLIILSNALANEHLIFAADLIRHGDRTPIHPMPGLFSSWQAGAGELTAEGMRQEFQLGKELGKKYIGVYHLLPTRYQVETLYIRSTDENRALASAESLLLGLYPLGTGPHLVNSKQPALPAAYQPIPIHTVPKKMDILLLAKPSKNIFLVATNYLMNYRIKKAETKTVKDKMKYLAQMTGVPFNEINQLRYLADNLYVQQCHHLPLPNGISQQTASEVIALSEKLTVNRFKRDSMLYPMGKIFLSTLVGYMKQVVQQKTRLKYMLFSGHDSSIMSVMSALGIPLDKKPKYASDLNFALFESDKRYYIKVSFNNKLLTIPSCSGNLCRLSDFYQLAR